MRLLEASLALPGPCFIPVPGTTKMLVRDDQWMISLAIRDRCRELGGEPRDHLERALMAMVPKGAA